jgi:phosphate acetyltransferase
MTNALYLTTIEPFSGKSIIALGLMNLLAGKTEKIAYFKPVVSTQRTQIDSHLNTISKHFGLTTPYNEMFSFTRDEVVMHQNAGRKAFIIDTIIEQFKKLQEKNDFVVVEGTDFMGDTSNLEFDGNISIAKNLGLPVVLIVKGEGKTVKEITDISETTAKSFLDEGVQILTVVANKVDPDKENEIKAQLQKKLPNGIIPTTIPQNKDLGNPTMKEILESVGGKVFDCYSG